MAEDENAEGGSENLTKRTASGLQWTYLNAAVSGVLQILMAAILARLLAPSAFGLLALANLTLRFVQYFSRVGIVPAVIQKQTLSRDDLRAAFAISMATGLAFTAIAWFLAPLAATFFTEPDLTPILRTMSLHLLIAGIGAPANGLLRRSFRFKEIAVIGVASYVIGYGVVGVPLAFAGAGAYSLVAATLTQSALTVIASIALTRPPMGLTRSRQSYNAIFGFGARVSIISFIEFLGKEVDTLAIGRFTGADLLGIYNRAHLLVQLPMSHLKHGFSGVLFPALSSIQTQPTRLRRSYLSAVSIMAGIAFPVCAGIAIASREIVLVVLGPDWILAASVLPWMSLAAATSLVAHFGGITSEAIGALNSKLLLVISKLTLLALLVFLVRQGPLWHFAAVFAVANVYSLLAYSVLISRLLRLRISAILKSLVPGLSTAALTAITIATIRIFLARAGTSASVILAAAIVTGSITLLASSRLGPLRPVARDIRRRIEASAMINAETKASKMMSNFSHFLFG